MIIVVFLTNIFVDFMYVYQVAIKFIDNKFLKLSFTVHSLKE